MKDTKMEVRKWLYALLISGTLVGCQLQDPPDPNDPKIAAPQDIAKVLHAQIQSTSDDLDYRVTSRQISDRERNELLAKRAQELLAEGDPQHCEPGDAWIYADLYITEKHYSEAIPLLKQAIKFSETVKDDDRRVNDSFRLARCLAETGQTEQALDLAQKIIASKPGDQGPVLPSVLLELTPLTEGKGHDQQLANLLEEAIHEHMLMKVDPNSDAGKMFLLARPVHIRHAWDKIIILLYQSGHPDQAKAAKAKEDAMMKTLLGQTTFA